MAKRPTLNDSSFLAAVFHPKKSPIPTGLRKSKIASVANRKASRVKSYNAMSALKQKVLKDSGQREAYLRGDATLADAKRALRSKAVNLGIVKAPKSKAPSRVVRSLPSEDAVVQHMYTQLTGGHVNGRVNVGTLRKHSKLMRQDQLSRVMSMMRQDIRNAGNDPSEKVVTSEGKEINPFWYH